MEHRWKRALPGALVLSVLAGACQDAPSGPRAPAARATPPTVASARTFSGASSDSLVDLVLNEWARLGHPEYRREVDAWRQKYVGTVHPAALPNAPDPRATPRSALITDTGESSVSPAAIFDHREALHFGSSAGIPALLEGEMTFTGDLGKISVGSFSITSKSGAAHTVTGDLVIGSGQLVSCQDATQTPCGSKRLAGSIPVNDAPVCDASASGNLLYNAQNIQSTFGVSTDPLSTVNTGDNTAQAASLSAQVNATAPACATTPPPPPPYQPPPDGGGSWGSPNPDPNAPPPATVPSSPNEPKDNYCYSYWDPSVLYVEVVCTAN